MSEIQPFEGKESNDNMPPMVGDWVTIPHEGRRAPVARHLGMDKFTVARTDYKKGMNVPIRSNEMRSDMAPAWGVSIDELKIEYKPKTIE